MKLLYQTLVILFISNASMLTAQHPAINEMKASLKEKIRFPRTTNQDSSATTSIEDMNFPQGKIGITQKPESEIHAAIHPEDSTRMLAAAMRFDPNSSLLPLDFTIYSTSNFGQNWTESTFRGNIPGNTTAGGGDPLVAYESNGKAHFIWLLLTFDAAQQGQVGIWHSTSSDNGFTWTQPTSPIVSGTLGLDPNTNEIIAIDQYVDKPWLAIDRSSGAGKDALYIAYFNLDLQPDTIPTIQCIRKPRNAGTFNSSPTQVNTNSYQNLQFASIDVDLNGVVHITFWGSVDGVNYALYHAKSTNSGTSFLPETKISDISFPLPNENGGFPPSDLPGVERLYPAPQLKIDKTNGARSGNMYLVWMANGISSPASSGYDIYFSRSIDGGDTWSSPNIVNDDSNPQTQQFFPSIEVSPKGLVILTWYDRRDDPQNIETQYYMTWSTDGGLSFSDQFSVSNQAADFDKIGDNNGGFGVGEYTQIISTPNQAIPFWADGRENNGRVRVYAGYVPLTEEPVVSVEKWEVISRSFSLENIYPNPAINALQINWEQAQKGMVTIGIFSHTGQFDQGNTF